MIQAAFCGYCTQMKPDFQKFADSNPNIFCATIQGDGKEPGEKELGNKLKKISPSFRGYPDVVGYYNGKYVSTNNLGRSKEDLEKFAKTIR